MAASAYDLCSCPHGASAACLLRVSTRMSVGHPSAVTASSPTAQVPDLADAATRTFRWSCRREVRASAGHRILLGPGRELLLHERLRRA